MSAFVAFLRHGHSFVLDEAHVPRTVIETVPSPGRGLEEAAFDERRSSNMGEPVRPTGRTDSREGSCVRRHVA